MLARWQEEDGEGSAAPRSEAPEPEAPGPEGEAVRVGARFPSAALRRRWENEEDEPAEEPSPDPDPAAAADAEPTLEPAPRQLPGAVAAFVRPYVLTGGRTRTARYLGVETLVSAHRNGRAPGHLRDQAHRAVVDLCSRPKSVAEVAALMMVPLGVARVLVGDLAHVGALFVHPAPTPSGMPDAVLMNRVLHGLRRL